jgi:serpin B
MPRHIRIDLVALMVALLILGCASSDPSPTSVTPTSAPRLTPSAQTPSAAAAATPVPIATVSPAPSDPLLGAVVVTVSDRLRVRSEPRVSDDSIKYEPLLPLGTELRVVGGPVSASEYVWYQVEPVSFTLSDGVERGWVAIADHDGEPWIARTDQPIAGLDVAMASRSRAQADPGQAATVSDSVTTFGLELYRAMLAEPALNLRDKNVVFSPTSIALALGMARAGARGETGAQMDEVLLADGWDELGPGLNALDQALSSRNGSYVDDNGDAHELALRIANASFAQRGWSIEQDYLDAIALAFGAGLQLVDYAGEPEAARKAINAWVSQKTNQRIPELLAPPNVTSSTRLYLVNAIYLKANWVTEFRKGDTAPRSFTRLDGSTVDVATMQLSGGQEVPYLRGDGWQATELRYRGERFSTPLAMTLIVPDDLASFEASVGATQLARLASDLTAERKRLQGASEPTSSDGEMVCPTYPYSLNLSMPRFSIGTRAELAKTMAALGMPLAFDPARADFSGIHDPTGGDGIFIKNVIHQANIDVDETGTEAAAATAVGADTTGGCGQPSPDREIDLRLNRPFLFVLRDIETGAVLFMGRVVDPSINP